MARNDRDQRGGHPLRKKDPQCPCGRCKGYSAAVRSPNRSKRNHALKRDNN